MTTANNDLIVGPVTPAEGVTTISLDFYFEDEDWLEVYRSDTVTALVKDTDYTVTGEGTSTGFITLLDAATGEEEYTVYLVVPAERASDLQLRGQFRSQPINVELDRLWQRIMHHDTRIDTTFRSRPHGGKLNQLTPAEGVIAFDANYQPTILPYTPLTTIDDGAIRYTSVAGLRISTEAARGTGSIWVVESEFGTYLYKEVSSGEDFTNAASTPVKFQVVAQQGEASVRAFGVVGDGSDEAADAQIAHDAALDRGFTLVVDCMIGVDSTGPAFSDNFDGVATNAGINLGTTTYRPAARLKIRFSGFLSGARQGYRNVTADTTTTPLVVKNIRAVEMEGIGFFDGGLTTGSGTLANAFVFAGVEDVVLPPVLFANDFTTIRCCGSPQRGAGRVSVGSILAQNCFGASVFFVKPYGAREVFHSGIISLDGADGEGRGCMTIDNDGTASDADVTPTSITSSGTTVTVTTPAAHGYTYSAGTPTYVSIYGADQGAYNGMFELTSTPTTTTFTYEARKVPAATTATGTLILRPNHGPIKKLIADRLDMRNTASDDNNTVLKIADGVETFHVSSIVAINVDEVLGNTQVGALRLAAETADWPMVAGRVDYIYCENTYRAVECVLSRSDWGPMSFGKIETKDTGTAVDVSLRTESGKRVLDHGTMSSLTVDGISMEGYWTGNTRGFACLVNPAQPASWQGSTAYIVDDRVCNDGKFYICTVAGTSAGSGGPTGTGSGISDGAGTLEWDYEVGPVNMVENVYLNITALKDGGAGIAQITNCRDVTISIGAVTGAFNENDINVLQNDGYLPLQGCLCVGNATTISIDFDQINTGSTGETDGRDGSGMHLHAKTSISVVGNRIFGGSWDGVPEWEDGKAYELGEKVWNDSAEKVYICVGAGTSAGSGGPTGTGSGITDNTVTWDYVAARNDNRPADALIKFAFPNEADEVTRLCDVKLSGFSMRNGFRGINVDNDSGITPGYGYGLRMEGLDFGQRVAPAWAATTAYVLGDTVQNGDHLYVCTVAGTSAGSGGPTGRDASGITDGSAEWGFRLLKTVEDNLANEDRLVYFTGANNKGLFEGLIADTPGAIAHQAQSVEVTANIPGVLRGDMITAAYDEDQDGCFPIIYADNNNVRCALGNLTGGAKTPGNGNWKVKAEPYRLQH